MGPRFLKLFFFLLLCARVCSAPVAIPGRLIIKHFEADGVGFNGGYSTVEGMMAAPFSYRHIPFADIRYHVFDRGRSALNGGIGYRYNIAGSGAIFGMNAYYDARWTTGQTFSQFGGGLEFLSRFLDLRFNGYFPVKDSLEIRSLTFDGFVGNTIAVKEKRRMAMTGGDGELGFYFGRLGDLKMYAAGGSYYFKRQQCNTKWGAKGRLRFSWLDNIWAEFSVEQDSFFGLNYQGRAALNLPFWKKPRTRKWSYFPHFEALIIQPPVRQEIIALCDISPVKPARDANGDIITVWFVDNTSSSDGTIESPFPTLAQAQGASAPNDIIYVFPGDGTTTGMDAGITLKQRQYFLGAGTAQPILLENGILTIPPQANGIPKITNLAGSAVVLSKRNSVRGFNIISPTMTGITGVNTGATVIDQITCTGATDGLSLTVTGRKKLGLALTNSTFSSGSMNGVLITSTARSDVEAAINKCTCSSNAIDGISFSNTGFATGTLNISNCTMQGNTADGIDIASGGESLTTSITNNKITTSGSRGVDIIASSSAIVDATLTGNTINIATRGIDLSTSATSQLTATINKNAITKTSGGGLVLDGSSGGTTTTVTATDNVISKTTGGDGILITSGTSNATTCTFTSNTIKDITTGPGLKIDPGTSGSVTCTATANSITNGNIGILIEESGVGSTISGTFTSNTIDTMVNECVEVKYTSATYNLTFKSNTFKSATGDNFFVENIGAATSTISLTLQSNKSMMSSQYGYKIVGANTANLTLSMTGNTADSNADDGILIECNQTGAGAINNITVDSNTLTSNDRGLSILTQNAASATLTVTNNNMTSNTNGTEVENMDTSTICMTFTGNTDDQNFEFISGGTSFSVVSSDGTSSDVQSKNTGTSSTPITFSPGTGSFAFPASCP